MLMSSAATCLQCCPPLANAGHEQADLIPSGVSSTLTGYGSESLARTVPLAVMSLTLMSSTTRRRKYSRPRRNVRAPSRRRRPRSLRVDKASEIGGTVLGIRSDEEWEKNDRHRRQHLHEHVHRGARGVLERIPDGVA